LVLCKSKPPKTGPFTGQLLVFESKEKGTPVEKYKWVTAGDDKKDFVVQQEQVILCVTGVKPGIMLHDTTLFKIIAGFVRKGGATASASALVLLERTSDEWQQRIAVVGDGHKVHYADFLRELIRVQRATPDGTDGPVLDRAEL
jgi:hypothetical protein